MSVEGVALHPLGMSALKLTALGLGTWQFSSGKGQLGSHWDLLSQRTMQRIVAAALDGGINWFDTAESYGDGASEMNLSRALRSLDIAPNDVCIADKWWPKQRKAQSLLETIELRKHCLQGYPIDLYQIHWPESQSWLRTEMKALAQLVDEGHVRAVGLCNYSSKLVAKAHRYLAKQGIPLASIQVHYNLLHRAIETNDILATANDLGISIIAWSPLEQGLLTGRFHRDQSSMFKLRARRKQMFGMTEGKLRQTQPLIDLLHQLGEKHSASCGQISLAWLTQFHPQQVFAIPGATSVEQVAQNTAALYLTLTSDELDALDAIAWHCIRS
jgi:aryl-alcohol dehydrogenase-like predicted oxidoreductase